MRQRPSLLHKNWNAAALGVALLSIVLMVLAVLSVDRAPSPIADGLRLTTTPSAGLNAPWMRQDSLLQRDGHASRGEVIADAPAADSHAMVVKVGLYGVNHYNIDLKVPSFDSTGYVWFQWDQSMQHYLQSHGLKIWTLIAPINLLNIPQSADSVFQPIGADAPIRKPDGSYYQIVAYKGTFFVDRTDFRRHPFTLLSLPIMLEADDINLAYPALRLEPDLSGTGSGQFVANSNGWINLGWSIAEYRHHYATDFGFGQGTSDYSQLVYEVTTSTAAWSSFWKLLVPLMIVMAMIVGATKMDPAQWEVRLTLPITVLLTLVFLQQGYSSELPPLHYLSFLDELYVVAYALTLGAFLLMLWGCRRYYKALDIQDEALRQIILTRLDRSDDSWPAAVMLAGVVAGVICWFTG
jgi:hypothetical protein